MKGEYIMDNNSYNNNQSSDSFYSYNQNQTAPNSGNPNPGTTETTGTAETSGGTERTYTAGTYTGGAYGSNAFAYQNGSQNGPGYQSGPGYPNGAYQQNGGYQAGGVFQQQPGGKKAKKKKERKPGGFGMKLAKCAALALVFGLVSGGVFEGVHFASRQISGEASNTGNTSSAVLSKSDGTDKLESTSTSNTYVGTDVSDIVEGAMPSIVAITNVSETEYQNIWGGMPQKFENTSAGSGIIVSQDNKYLYIATNNHVVNGATSLTVNFVDNKTVSAEVKGTDPSTDLAVIRVLLDNIEKETMDKIKVATLGSSDNLRVGEASIAIGNALGYGQSVTTGCISAVDREVSVSDTSSNTSYTLSLIQTDAAINPGNSGGALLNAVGEVIGINSVKYSDTSVEGIGYAIPISTATPIIEDLITKEKVDESESAYLGVAGLDVTNEMTEMYGMPAGAYVVQVIEGSAADMAGIKKGDVITELDGRKVASMQELTNILQYYKAGTTVDVKIQRTSDGEYSEQTVTITLGNKI